MIITSTNIYYDGDYFGEEITVYLGDDAVIVDSRFNELYFDDLLRDDIVNIKGSYDGSTFIANRIILE